MYASRFADFVSDERFDKAVSEGKRLIAVSVPSNAASVANQLKAGDKVTVAYYADDTVIIDDALKGIEIYSVENEDAQNLENVQGSEDKEDDNRRERNAYCNGRTGGEAHQCRVFG